MSMLEPFDAPMLDYPSDLDVPMHSSSSDTWFLAEAAMDDTNTPLASLSQRPALHDPDNLSIEVDMETYEDDLEHTSEYEMADDIQDHSAELLDVEVYDASLAHTPLPVPDDGSYSVQEINQVSYGALNEQSALSLSHPSPADIPIPDSTSEHQLPQHTSDSVLPGEELGDNSSTQQDYGHVQAQETGDVGEQNPAVAPRIPDFVEGSSLEPTAQNVEENEVTSGSNHEPSIDNGDHSTSRVYATADAILESQSHTLLNGALGQGKEADGIQSVTPNGTENPPISSAYQDSSFDENPTLELENTISAERSYKNAADGGDAGENEHEVQAVEDEDRETVVEVTDREDAVDNNEVSQALVSEDSTSTGDPHEISEGVYIDPPPPVLLSISGQVEVSLFNEASTSGASSSPVESEDQLQTAHVLLQNFPTLYYEPISSVFEALRQDDYITNISEYTDSELVLDAYDLQLVISEDNIFAREISLHDLNALHDASGIAGPLRLRMQTIAPRFIVRYRMLQDQAIRLHEPAGEDDGNQVSGNDYHEVDGRLQPQAEVDDIREESSFPENTSDVEHVGHSSETTEPNPSGDVEGTVALELDSGNDSFTHLESNELQKMSQEYSVDDEGNNADAPETPKISSPHEDEGSIIGNDLPTQTLSPIEHNDVTDSNEHVSEPASGHEDDAESQGAVGNASAIAGTDDYNDEDWDDDDAEGDLDTYSGAENEVDAISNESSVTLSSKGSKRSFDEADLEHDDTADLPPFPSSPGKRLRVE